MRKSSFVAVLVFALMACGTSKVLFEPVQADVQRMAQGGITTDLAALQHGYQLFSQHCSSCHGLTAPPRKSMEQWNRILPKMFPKTKMTPAEQELVKSYIAARR